MCRHTPVCITLFHFASLFVVSTSSWSSAWYIETPREYPPTFESIFPPQGLSLSIPFILTWSCYSRIKDRKESLISIIFSYVSSYLCKLLGFRAWEENLWLLLEDARVTDDYRFIMSSRQASPGTLQLHAHHWYRRHHKWSSCEPVSAQVGAFTGDLCQQHLAG